MSRKQTPLTTHWQTLDSGKTYGFCPNDGHVLQFQIRLRRIWSPTEPTEARDHCPVCDYASEPRS